MTEELLPVTEPVIRPDEARVNITYSGLNADLPEPVQFDSSDAQVKTWAAEAVASGTVPGLPQDVRADFSDFIVERYPAGPNRPQPLLLLRPKVPFGIL